MTHKFTLIFNDLSLYENFKHYLDKGMNSDLFVDIKGLNLPTQTKFDNSPCVSADIIFAILGLNNVRPYPSSILRDVEHIENIHTTLLTVTADKSFKYVFDDVDVRGLIIREGHSQIKESKKVLPKPKQSKQTIISPMCDKVSGIDDTLQISPQEYYIEDVIHQICNLLGINHTKYFYNGSECYSISRNIEGLTKLPLSTIQSTTATFEGLANIGHELSMSKTYIYKILLLDSLTLNNTRNLNNLYIYVETSSNAPLRFAPIQHNHKAFSQGVSLTSRSALVVSETLGSVGLKAYMKLRDFFPKDKYLQLISSFEGEVKDKLIYTANEILK